MIGRAAAKADVSKDLKTFHKKAKALVAKLAADRDGLRRLIEDYRDILSTADDAAEDFEVAIDKLSELL